MIYIRVKRGEYLDSYYVSKSPLLYGFYTNNKKYALSFNTKDGARKFIETQADSNVYTISMR